MGDVCITNPLLSECTSFTLPVANSTASMTNLCNQMSYMPGCSLNTWCQKSNKKNDFCDAFSLLGDVCFADMPRMRDCSSYTQMCLGYNISVPSTAPSMKPSTPSSFQDAFTKFTKVDQCSKVLPLPNFPSTDTVNARIKSICSEMNMEGCDRCKINPSVSSTYLDCDQLEVYSLLCKSMPDMNQCKEWSAMCSSTPQLPYCVSGEGAILAPPAMKMYFHTGISEYVLFQNYIPRTPVQYGFTILFIMILAIIHEAIVAWHSVLESRWMSKNKDSTCYPYRARFAMTRRVASTEAQPSTSSHTQTTVNADTVTAGPRSHLMGLYITFSRFFLKFFSVLIGYSLMLIAMTFNVGLFFAVIVGYALGSSLYSGWVRKEYLFLHSKEKNEDGQEQLEQYEKGFSARDCC